METRFLLCDSCEVIIEDRGEGKQPVITGYAAVFYDGTKNTEYQLWPGAVERVMPGAFAKSVGDDVRATFNHDPSLILGRTKKGKTLRLSVDDKGLRYEIDPPDTQAGRDLMTSLKRGDVTGSSFSFAVDGAAGENWTKDGSGNQVRELRLVKLFDVGPVTFPAYKLTQASARHIGHISEACQSYEAWLRQRRLLALDLEEMDM